MAGGLKWLLKLLVEEEGASVEARRGGEMRYERRDMRDETG
jgi:hypothetical protein